MSIIKLNLKKFYISCLLLISLTGFTFSGSATAYGVGNSWKNANACTSENLVGKSLVKSKQFYSQYGRSDFILVPPLNIGLSN